MVSSIGPIVFIVFPRPVQDLGVLGALKRLCFRLLRLKKVPVEDLFLDVFVRLGGGSMPLRTVSIHFSDPRWKVKSGFCLCGNGLLNIGGSRLASRSLRQYSIFEG